ncbi:MAG: (d)CMP kinase [candidate division WOR-3 bacterium]|nr:(d)CMP kinase [candidate division WOR-3 bacterium]MCX7947331.1 (d)CMP kinase [candidate division WOR-3 bacterium]MDW8150113.1 (d)CMP kinase [candidate division WOR-3 bacterium]
MIIAIDGPAGSGKSSIAKKLSEILNIKYVETGALYRAIAYYIIQNKMQNYNNFEFLKNLKIEQKFINKTARTFLNGEDITDNIKDEKVGNLASEISKFKQVRDFLIDIQRELSKDGAIVEGRDIGTVVLKDADYKFYITAKLEERAMRRYKQLNKSNVSYEDILEILKNRDISDLNREISPLRPSRDAFIIDTTNLREDEVIEEILDIIRKNLCIGTVISREGQKLSVISKGKVFRAIPRGKLLKSERKIYVGDIVVGKREGEFFVIEKIKERTNLLPRPPIANVSKCILMFTIREPEIVQIQLDKILCACEFLNIPSIIVFNKVDITPNEELERYVSIYKDAGYEVITVSVKENMNLDILLNRIRGDLVVLAGPSGVGKSSLIKALANVDIRIGEVSKRLKRGTQTTTEVKLYSIDNETFIADTPGFSKIELNEIMKKEDVRNCFREFSKYKCAFRDCFHIKEEGCSIVEAVSMGKINKERYENYLKIITKFL